MQVSALVTGEAETNMVVKNMKNTNSNERFFFKPARCGVCYAQIK